MKTKLKNLLPYICLFIVIFIIHLCLNINIGDDIFFKNISFDNNGYFNFLKSRYNNWSSRLIIETILVILCHCPAIIWCILNSLVIVLLTYIITKLFSNGQLSHKWLACLLFFLYPLIIMSSAGWRSTTLNYLWPLTFGLYSFIPIKNIINGKKEHPAKLILYSLCLIFACNQEQMCAVIFAFYTIFLIYFCKTQKPKTYIIIQTALSLLSLIFILTCPGNAVRMETEISIYFSEFGNLSIIDKLLIGTITSTSYYLLHSTLPIIILLGIITILAFKNKKSLFCKISSVLILSIYISLSFIKLINIQLIKNLYFYINNLAFSENRILITILTVISLILFSVIIKLIHTVIDNKNEKYLFSLILLAGLSSRIIIGFSPTMFVSGARTFIFMHFSIIIIIFKLLQNLIKHININRQPIYIKILTIIILAILLIPYIYHYVYGFY